MTDGAFGAASASASKPSLDEPRPMNAALNPQYSRNERLLTIIVADSFPPGLIRLTHRGADP
jgi:hypothetical protein